MDLTPFQLLPGSARLWVYGFPAQLGEPEQRSIVSTLESFLAQWKTHSQPVASACTIAYGRFVLLAGTAPGGISGCAVDSSVRVFKEIRERLGLDGLDRRLIYYREPSGDILALPFQEFGEKIVQGWISPDCTVFDTTLSTLDELRCGGLERPFRESWHQRSFPAAEKAGLHG